MRKALLTGSLLLLAVLIFCRTACAAPSSPNFTGHYELADAHGDHSFSLDVQQTDAKADFSFSAAMADGSGAAPDGDGTGKVNAAGVLVFTFKDSFENEGTGTLTKTKSGYLLTLDAKKVQEPRPLRFYGEVHLRKTANKPQPL